MGCHRYKRFMDGSRHTREELHTGTSQRRDGGAFQCGPVGGTVAYYWIAGGAKNVSYTAIVGGISFSASTTFNVLSPICLSFTSTTTTDTPPVNCDDPAWGTGLALHFGSNKNAPSSYGITWSAQVTTPAGGSGEFGVTQLIKTERHQTLASTGTTTQTWSSNGAYVLDDQVFQASTG